MGFINFFQALNVGIPILVGMLMFYLAEKFMAALTGITSSQKVSVDFLLTGNGSHQHAHTHSHSHSHVIACDTGRTHVVKVKLSCALCKLTNHQQCVNKCTSDETMEANVAHGVPHNIADFAILIQNGFSHSSALWAQDTSFSTTLLETLAMAVGVLMNVGMLVLENSVPGACAH
eukprot:767700-Hanusia_phi.AAC.6